MEIISYEDYAEIIILSPKHGELRVKIDLEDVDRCKEYRWCANKFKKLNYERMYIVNSKLGMLHRFIMNAGKGKVVDHINGDTLNNRKSNLRICLHGENSRNSKFRVNNTSGHKGISWHKKTNKWIAHITVDHVQKTLGYFENIEDAVVARSKAEEEYFGEYRNT